MHKINITQNLMFFLILLPVVYLRQSVAARTMLLISYLQFLTLQSNYYTTTTAFHSLSESKPKALLVKRKIFVKSNHGFFDACIRLSLAQISKSTTTEFRPVIISISFVRYKRQMIEFRFHEFIWIR